MLDFESLFSADGKNFRPSAIRAFASLINDPSVISFAGGLPSPQTFPAEQLSVIAERLIREQKLVALQYGPTRGIPRLREFVVALCASRGISCSVDQVMITTGSQQALSVVSHALLDPGDVVLVELPTYIGATASFYARRAELAGVAQDDDGIVPSSLEETARRLDSEGRRIKFLYTIPNFQNPSGRLMAPGRRNVVLEIAQRHRFAILEDDPYGELVFDDGAITRPIRSSADASDVIYLGSFSKILAPGLRCGFLVAPEPLLRKCELAKEAADLCSGMLDQSIVDEFCAAGELPRQIERVRDFYRARRDVLMEALDLHFSGKAVWTRARGGLFTFLTLRRACDTRDFVKESVASGVAYIPGAPFFVDGSGTSSMRLTFAKEPDDRMREGVARLARVF